METELTIGHILLFIYVAGSTVGFIFILSWIGACYLTPYLSPYIERFEERLISIDSKVKRLSERLKTNDTDSIKAEAKLKKLKTN